MRAELREETLLCDSSWERGPSNQREAALQHRVSARGGAPRAEQQLPAAQQRPVVEQAVPLQPAGVARSPSPRTATEELPVPQRMRPGETRHADGSGPRRAARGAAEGPGQLPPPGTAPEWCLKGGPRVWSRAGAALGELQAEGSPRGIRSGTTTFLNERGTHVELGCEWPWVAGTTVTGWLQPMFPCSAQREEKRWVRERWFPIAFSSRCSGLLVTPMLALFCPLWWLESFRLYMDKSRSNLVCPYKLILLLRGSVPHKPPKAPWNNMDSVILSSLGRIEFKMDISSVHANTFIEEKKGSIVNFSRLLYLCATQQFNICLSVNFSAHPALQKWMG